MRVAGYEPHYFGAGNLIRCPHSTRDRQALCKEKKGLRASGKKEELIARLEDGADKLPATAPKKEDEAAPEIPEKEKPIERVFREEFLH